jgi:hypothetical protein
MKGGNEKNTEENIEKIRVFKKQRIAKFCRTA